MILRRAQDLKQSCGFSLLSFNLFVFVLQFSSIYMYKYKYSYDKTDLKQTARKHKRCVLQLSAQLIKVFRLSLCLFYHIKLLDKTPRCQTFN